MSILKKMTTVKKGDVSAHSSLSSRLQNRTYIDHGLQRCKKHIFLFTLFFGHLHMYYIFKRMHVHLLVNKNENAMCL